MLRYLEKCTTRRAVGRVLPAFSQHTHVYHPSLLLIQSRSVVFIRNNKKMDKNEELVINMPGQKKKLTQPKNQVRTKNQKIDMVRIQKLKREQEIKAQKYENNLTHQLKSLESFTKKVEHAIKIKKDQKEQEKVKNELGSVEDTIDHDDKLEEDAEAIFEALLGQEPTQFKNDNLLAASEERLQLEEEKTKTQEETINDEFSLVGFDPADLELFPQAKPYVDLPDSIYLALDDQTTKHIVRKENANWIPVIDKLYNDPNIPFKECTTKEIYRLIKNIPKEQRPLVITKIHQMITDSKLDRSIHIYNVLMASYNLVSVKETKNILEMLYNELMDPKKNIEPNLTTYGIMINMYAKNGKIKQVKDFLDLYTALGGQPNKVIYTSVLQMYVRLNKYEQALDTFTTMKFLSVETAPGPRTYTSIILLDMLNNNIEHALDLYDEMENSKIKPEPATLLALAKGCAMRPQLAQKGWSFIIDYHDHEYPMTSQVIEVMMRLAGKDSDINFVRALYLNLFQTNTSINQGQLASAGPIALHYLFNAYADYDPKKTPASLMVNKVRAIRFATLGSMKFEFHAEAPPLLPIRELPLGNKSMLVNESKALLNYHLKKFPDMVSEHVIRSYLFMLASCADSIQTFEKELNRLTFFKSDEGSNEITIEYPEEEQQQDEQQDEGIDETDATTTNKKASLEKVDEIDIKSPVLIPRSDFIYSACIRAATNFKDVIFAQRIWIERGQFRKTEEFQQLGASEQEESDFRMARSILRCFIECGNFNDGYKLVLSSQNRFVWTYYHLKDLMSLCEQYGFGAYKDELMKVVKKSNKFIRRSTSKAEASVNNNNH